MQKVLILATPFASAPRENPADFKQQANPLDTSALDTPEGGISFARLINAITLNGK